MLRRDMFVFVGVEHHRPEANPCELPRGIERDRAGLEGYGAGTLPHVRSGYPPRVRRATA